MNKTFIEDLEVRDKLVVVRSDLNVPIKNKDIQDDSRIQASLATFQYLRQQGARTFVLSHLGRPKGKIIEELRLQPIATRLCELLGVEVAYSQDCIGPQAEQTIARLQPGSIALLENVRFHEEETKNDSNFANQLAHKADYFINDAFGTAHRAHASTSGITKHVKTSAAGYLVRKELDYLGKIITQPQHPFFVVYGGAKVSDKIQLLTKLLSTLADRMLIGGAMAFTFLRALGYETGLSLVEEEQIQLAKSILQRYDSKLELPTDILVSPLLDIQAGKIGPLSVVPANGIPVDHYGLDIGPQTVKRFEQLLLEAQLVFWNGPMGVFEIEQTAEGTHSIARIMARITQESNATTVIGGGDSASAIVKAGLEERVSHVSTGGGAALVFLEGTDLPGITALTDA